MKPRKRRQYIAVLESLETRQLLSLDVSALSSLPTTDKPCVVERPNLSVAELAKIDRVFAGPAEVSRLPRQSIPAPGNCTKQAPVGLATSAEVPNEFAIAPLFSPVHFEGLVPYYFVVTRTNTSAQQSVTFNVRPGLVNGADFSDLFNWPRPNPRHRTVTFAPGQTAALVIIFAAPDAIPEADETFDVYLEANGAFATGVILNDD